MPRIPSAAALFVFSIVIAGENLRLNQINFWNNSTFHILLSSKIQSGHSEKLNIKKLPKTRLRGLKMQIGFLGKFDLTFLAYLLVIALTQTRMYLLCVKGIA